MTTVLLVSYAVTVAVLPVYYWALYKKLPAFRPNAFLERLRFDGATRTVTMDLTFFVRKEGDLYRRFSEIHAQRAHEPERLRQLLAENGFSDIRVFGDRTFEAPEPNALRVHIAATRE